MVGERAVDENSERKTTESFMTCDEEGRVGEFNCDLNARR